MKKSLILLGVIILVSTLAFSPAKKKTVEVLYFKANLTCCKQRSCNALEGDVKNIVTKNYPGGEVIFRTVLLAEESNKELVNKYKAKSQTVIIVAKTKKKEYTCDVTPVIKAYVQNQDKSLLEQQLKAKINELLAK